MGYSLGWWRSNGGENVISLFSAAFPFRLINKNTTTHLFGESRNRNGQIYAKSHNHFLTKIFCCWICGESVLCWICGKVWIFRAALKASHFAEYSGKWAEERSGMNGLKFITSLFSFPVANSRKNILSIMFMWNKPNWRFQGRPLERNSKKKKIDCEQNLGKEEDVYSF